ncbi:hypothetical protein B0J13DRAFT_132574 [Dactylonectria estremocensis]|uniref:Peptidase C1A papain C-terminal domain-containing protein n=1 Tax=Dactylonectria estremocensis TaxID=1079267 RepID=A0A9P9ISW2_9HYPO|nr:hypothetical protein B0J13DRAFT_132574 [Dactylonectria estremocensis]
MQRCGAGRILLAAALCSLRIGRCSAGPRWPGQSRMPTSTTSIYARLGNLLTREIRRLATFHLSKSGWEYFSRHLGTEATAKLVLTRQDMPVEPSDTSGGGHVVVLTGCGPHSLTLLNSWGRNWGDEGKFCVEDHTILDSAGFPMCFYDVYWLEKDLKESERKAFDTKVDEAILSRAAHWPSIFEFEALCPLCGKSAPIANFAGSIRRAICPQCRGSFEPEPGHLMQALYMRAGLGDAS